MRRGDIHEIKDVMEKSENLGMQTFDQALYQLYKNGRITQEEALRNADSRNNLSLRIRLDESGKVDITYRSVVMRTLTNDVAVVEPAKRVY